MTKAVLTTKVSPVYDDLPENRYHFPKAYLNQVSKAVGDWIVYYEPRRSTGELSSSGGRQVYFATARVESIYPDPVLVDHFYAEISNYLPFVRPVPFKEGMHYYETGLEKEDGSTNKGAFGRAVRTLSDDEYDLIWQAGFGHVIGLEERARPAPDIPEEPMPPTVWLAEEPSETHDRVPMEQDRRIVEQLVSRPFRDKAFSAAVKSAYHDTCAAHIRPVEHRGPDSVRNGIALSGTVHWMFDRGLISIDDDFSLLLAKGRLPDTAVRLFNVNVKLLLPERLELRPHRQFLDYHRQNIFKG